MLFAEQISDQGKGIGIAEKVYQFLTGEDLPIARIISQPKPVVEIQPKQRPERKTAEVAQNLEKVAPTRELNKGNFLDRVKNRIEVYDNIINAASERFGIKPEMIKAVITAESAGHNYAKSKAGAKGLMQLMDGTARDLGVTDSFDPAQNIFGGARYLKQMLDKFGNNQELALAAYNAGPGNVQKYGGIPPFKETQGYIKKVNKYLQQFLTENIENQGI
ncbi:MAG: lytic transglycosylase domain-containing protein [Candidatus Kapabacteria bacterium]|nr:lytic transglycosylase domain-containing protein [Ignavibacteriota bacterium]MCW5885780.1 lytic transglycosylase domain-containing protein [Candidatus Kapabacteria bacterium]